MTYETIQKVIMALLFLSIIIGNLSDDDYRCSITKHIQQIICFTFVIATLIVNGVIE